jgi:hypothetical protein
MMIQKATRAFAVIAVLILLFVDSPSHAKDVYKWVDEKGTIHFSEDASSVPEKYRDQLEKKSMPEESKPPEAKVKAKKQDAKAAKEKPARKEKKGIDVNQIEADVIESVKMILSLWKDGKYHDLYNYGDHKSRMGLNKESFEQRMTKKGIGLASSWEAIRDIKVEVKSATQAYAIVKIGFKPTRGGETKFRTETFRMSLEKGMWKTSLSKILSIKI